MAPHILAVLIFVVMFVLIVMDKIERQYVSLGCGLLMIVLVLGLGMHSKDAIVETLNVKSIFQASFWYTAAEGEASSSGINWSTIIFILGMMIMVEGMGKAGFFRWLCLEIAKLVKYRTIPVFITFMLMSFVLAMFIDSITVILFLAAVTLELAQTLKCNPVPIILSEIFCANLGGSATMCGDPPNIIIGTSLGAISVRAALADWRVYVVSAVRLLVCPLLTWLVLRPFVSGALLGIPVLLAACPSAMVVTALCLQYDRSDAFASKCIFLNTILSAVTIPLLIWLLF